MPQKQPKFFCVCFQVLLFIYDFIPVTLGTLDLHLENDTHSHEECVMAQLVEALHCKPESCRFDSQLDQWNFSVTQFSLLHYGPGFVLASSRNEYQGVSWAVKAAAV